MADSEKEMEGEGSSQKLDAVQKQLSEIRVLLEKKFSEQEVYFRRHTSIFAGAEGMFRQTSGGEHESRDDFPVEKTSRSSVRITINNNPDRSAPSLVPPLDTGGSPDDDLGIRTPMDSELNSDVKDAKGSMLTGESDRMTERTTLSRASRASNGSMASFVDGISEEHRNRAIVQARRLRASRVDHNLTKRPLSVPEQWRSKARAIINSPTFSNCILLLILVNVILLGVEVDLSAKVGIQDVPGWLGVANTVIVVVFLIELILKFLVLGCYDFWCHKEASWNVFDFLIIAVSVVDVLVDILATTMSTDVNTGHLRLIRSIRLARALRSIRMVWLFQYVGALRTLALSIVSTLGSLFWTLMLLLIIFYSFGVVITQLAVEHCRFLTVESTGDVNAVPVCPDGLETYWSNVLRSMLTLFMSITGGLDWEAPYRPLREFSDVAAGLVVIYVALTVLAILNVVTGVFCNTAIESAASDKDVATLRQMQAKNKQVETLRSIFQELDRGKTNELSIEDINEAIEQGETLFMLLDSDKEGCIDLDEFVTGCMQLHGPAKSMQIAKMSFENKLARQALKNLSKEVKALRYGLIAMCSQPPSSEVF
eukprot:symbB.v1.2.018219.t1/scaffold1372.1/size122781/4